MWNDASMDEKRAARVLFEIIAHSTAALNPAYAGGDSIIIKLLTPGGQHIGTVHEIHLPDGSVPHSHPKDYTARDCSRYRVANESEG